MGIYNARKDLPDSLSKNRCPLSGKNIEPTDFNPEQDSFEYICEDLKSDTVISISGSLVSRIEEIVKDNPIKIKWLISEIQKTEEKFFMISTQTFS